MSTSEKRKLPIGIQSLQKLRAEGCYYVDKTPLALQMVASGSYYFLSRPRRFGKSLFLDTLKELFEGNRALFEGLYAEKHWDWETQHPVLRLSFADGVLRSREELDRRILDQLGQICATLALPLPDPTDVAGGFARIIREAASKHGQRTVLLIDEYDKPILDNLDSPEIAAEMREGLKNIYSVIKGADPHLRFVLLTGVSKFSKVSLFSGLNNLRDITLASEYSAICGYTEKDVDSVFAPELPGLGRHQIREWYNGYNWLGESVYNPYDLLLLFQERKFRSFWYETGTPTFLLKLLAKRETFLPEIGNLVADEMLLSTFDVDNIPVEALLFQSGYLTIAEQIVEFDLYRYRLRYPNREVYQSLNNNLLVDWTPRPAESGNTRSRLGHLLLRNDLAGMGELFKGFFESIPHQWHDNNPITRYEGYYASVFYAFFAALGLDITVEESSKAGRLDMAVRFKGRVLVFEFKMVEAGAPPDGNSALARLKLFFL